MISRLVPIVISVVVITIINSIIIVVIVPVIPVTATVTVTVINNSKMYRTNTCSSCSRGIRFVPTNRIDTSSSTTMTMTNTKRQRPAFIVPSSSSTPYYHDNNNRLFAFTTLSRSGFLGRNYQDKQEQEIEPVTRYQYPFLSIQSYSLNGNTNQRLFSSRTKNNSNDNNKIVNISEDNSDNADDDEEDEMEYETDDDSDDNDNGTTIQQGIKPQSISSYLEQSKNVPNNQQGGQAGQQTIPKKVVPSGPWTVPETITIPESRLEFSYVRSSGAGGQNVNKVNTQVQIRFKLDEANWIPLEVRDRIIENNKNIINKDGYLYVSSQEFRTQKDNKNSALYKIETIILKAYPRPNIRLVPKVGLSDISKIHRKKIKQHRKQIKQHRTGNNIKLGKFDFD